jgi:NTE family protein
MMKQKSSKIGLALSGGAAKGLAHIGVVKALEEADTPIDFVAGTSMGAMVGACFAHDGEISVIEEVALNIGWEQLTRLLDPRFSFLGKGLIRGQRIEALLRALIGDAEFKDLKIPLALVATDVNSGQEVIFRKGPVVQSVRASISIPGVFVPVTLEGRCLVDGGLVNPVPVDILRDMGAKFIIASNVITEKSTNPVISKKCNAASIPNIFHTLIQSLHIMEYEIIKLKTLNADVIITPDVSHIEAYDFHRGEEAIQAGYDAARKAIPKIQNFIKSSINPP